MSLADQWAVATTGEIVASYFLMIAAALGKLYLIGCAFYFVERLRPTVPGQGFFKKDFFNELGYPIINSVITSPLFTLLSLLLTTHVLVPYLPNHVIADQVGAMPFAVQVLFVMLVADVAVYVEHWFAHKVLWNYHALHHMTPEVNWLTHARVHPVNALTIALASLVAHFVFGLSGSAVAVGAGLSSAIAVWEHANLDFAWPKPFCYLLVSPRFHRWHHSSDAAAVDKNFCLIFPFLDLLMGTYYCPDRMPTAYGVHRANEDEPAIPDRFAGQIAYPFLRTFEAAGRRFGRRA